jgi:trehalose utilization protein
MKALLRMMAGVAATSVMTGPVELPATESIQVLIWDERQQEQKSAYGQWLGEVIGGQLQQNPRIQVRHAFPDAPMKGLDPDVLDQTDVLIWWGHRRHSEISSSDAAPVIDRLRAGRLSLIALHSSHWATPFMEAMNEKTRQQAMEMFAVGKAGEEAQFEFIEPGGRRPPHPRSMQTPFFHATGGRWDALRVRVDLPNCCFPAWRADGRPGRLQVMNPGHPLVRGLPLQFTLPQTEMYSEPFHVPEPDDVIFHETWEAGEWFRSGMVWNVGRGRVFYFRPGHETYPVFNQPEVQKLMENAVLWLGETGAAARHGHRPPNFRTGQLVAWCIVPFDSSRRGPVERVQMLKDLGLTRVAYDWRAEHVDQFEQEILEYRKNGIEFTAFWDMHPRAFELFRKYDLNPEVWKTAPSPDAETDSERVRLAAGLLRPVVEETRSLGSRLGLYNHGGWGGQPENLVAVCQYIRTHFNAPHVGIVYNFHHAHDRIADFEKNLELMRPYLLCLNINGMNDGADPKILGLGHGQHERTMIRTILDSGYAGPVGILDHQSDRDTAEVLSGNIAGLNRIMDEILRTEE